MDSAATGLNDHDRRRRVRKSWKSLATRDGRNGSGHPAASNVSC